MYLLHAAIVADRLAAFAREADADRLAALARESDRSHDDDSGRPGVARRLIARAALSVSDASARVASWSDPTICTGAVS